MKHPIRTLTSFFLCLLLVFSTACSVMYGKAASPSYTDTQKTYTIRQLTSDYQFFVRNELQSNNHFVGAAACGGKAYLNSFGDGAIVPSYFDTVLSLNNYNGQNNSHYLASDSKYKDLCKQPAYYKNANRNYPSLTKYPDKNNAYIRFDSAFTSLIRESADMMDQASLTLSMNQMHYVSFDGNNGWLLTIPFSKTVHSVRIPKRIIKKADWILIDGVKDLKELAETDHIISIEQSKARLGMMHGSDDMMQLNREIHQTELDMEHALQEGDIEKARTLKETRENLQASREKLEKKNRRVSKNKVPVVGENEIADVVALSASVPHRISVP